MHTRGVIPRWHARLAGVLDQGAATFPVTNPATGHVIAQVSACRRQHVLLALEAACSVESDLRDADSNKKAMLLRTWAAMLAQEADRVATTVTIETGKPISEARREVRAAVRVIESYAGSSSQSKVSAVIEYRDEWQLKRQLRGIGPVVAITNWCQPVLTVVRRVAPAFVAGCPVILKPSSRTPLSALTIANLWSDAGAPEGSLQVLTTDDPLATTDVCLADPRVAMVSFTGSRDVGLHLARMCADVRRDAFLEVDGQMPFIVLADADVERAADAVIEVTFMRNSGQDCTSSNRVYVDQRIASQFVSAVAARASELRHGDPLDEHTEVGPLIDSLTLTIIEEQIEDSVADGAVVVAGGKRLGGLYFAPTVLDRVRPGMRVVEDAHAGPLLPVLRFTDGDELIEMTSSGRKGRCAWIWTRDDGIAHRLAAKMGYQDVWINDVGETYPDRSEARIAWGDLGEAARYLRSVTIASSACEIEAKREK
ncbi:MULTISPECIES: aldehyde dehydrogenase family protein [unclassified Burkholderia]|nr:MULTISPECIES: aldehyde dehydrogenase family protein [unclassified Burkholderia]